MGKDSRAVLVLKGNPKKCMWCRFSTIDMKTGEMRCKASGRIVAAGDAPDTCPLIPLGEFMERERRGEHGL